MFGAFTQAQTPVVYFPFDGQSLSSSNGSYTLSTEAGMAGYTSSTKSGNGTHALSLNGASHLSAPYIMDTSITGFTASVWIKRSDASSQNGVFLAQLEVHNIQPAVTIYPATFNLSLNSGKVYTEWYPSSIQSYSMITADTLDFNWNHVALVWKKNSASSYHVFLYINGKCTDSTMASDKLNTSARAIPLSIGAFRTRKIYAPANQYSSGYFTGIVDEVKIFETDLSTQKINQIYQGNSSHISTIAAAKATVFPSPAYDNVTVRAEFGIQKIVLFDAAGKLIKEFEFEGLNKSESLNTNDLTPGNYVMKVTGKNTSQNLKLIKL